MLDLPFLDTGFKAESPQTVAALAADRGPILRFTLPSGVAAWLVADPLLAASLLSDPRLTKQQRPGERATHRLFDHLLVKDPPEHTRLRRVLARAMLAWDSARVQDMVSLITRDLIVPLREKATFDVVADFTMPLALRNICGIVGIPGRDRQKVLDWNQALLAAEMDGHPDAFDIAEDIELYLKSLMDDPSAPPQGSALSALQQAVSASDITSSEAFASAFVLVSAGFETSAHMMSSAVAILLDHPAAWTRLAADDAFAATVVEESLRLSTPLEFSTPRIAREELNLADQVIEPGELVFMALGAANRDAKLFDKPNDFNPGRANLRASLAFGRGPHTCPGSAIARATARAALPILASAFPALSRDIGPGTLNWMPGLIMRGLLTLKVRQSVAPSSPA